MRNKFRFEVIALLLCVAVCLGACEGRTREEDSRGGSRIYETKKGLCYTFQDEEGNDYDAPLLENVPRCSYDFKYLKTDETTGFKSYADPKNHVKAQLGIDVSEFQGEAIDWKQVKDSGVEFALIRLGYRAYGETGELVEDDMFAQNIEGALAAGLKVGVYFFSQAISGAEAVEEAEFVLEHLKHYEIDGPIVCDTEEIPYDQARTDVNTPQDFTNYCKVFCDTVEHAGYESMIYTNMKWMAFSLDMEELSEYEFWYADYHDTPQCPYNYKIWQYTQNGAVPGINTNVDLNLWFQEEN